MKILQVLAPFVVLCAASTAGAGEIAPAATEPVAEVVVLDATPESRAIGAALRAARSAPDEDPAQLVTRIARSGSGALAAAFDVLVRRTVPEAETGDGPQTLSAPQRTILLRALASLSHEDVRAHALARLRAATTDSAAVQLALVEVFGVVGSSKDLQRIAALAPRKSDDGEALTREARVALREACASILQRDARAWDVISDIVRTTDHAAARAMLEAVGSQRDPRALAVLFGSVNCHPDLRALAVGAVQKVGPSSDGAIEHDFAAWMAGEITSARKEHRQGLLQGIGVLDDGTNAQYLIDALGDDEPEVREAACWALRRLTGFGYPSSPEPWRAWYRGEMRWNGAERERARADLASREPARVVAGLRAYSGRRAWRESLGEEVATVLQRAEPGLRLAACEVLEGLRARSAIRPLAALLVAPEENVRDAARRALHTISGLDLPEDPRLAMEALNLL